MDDSDSDSDGGGDAGWFKLRAKRKARRRVQQYAADPQCIMYNTYYLFILYNTIMYYGAGPPPVARNRPPKSPGVCGRGGGPGVASNLRTFP